LRGAVLTAAIAAISFGPAVAGAAPDPATDLPGFMRHAFAAACETPPEDAHALAARFTGVRLLGANVDTFRGQAGRARHALLLPDGGELRVTRLFPLGKLRRVTVAYHRALSETRTTPVIAVMGGANCTIGSVRRITYGNGGAHELLILQPDFTSIIAREPLNPPVPEGTDPGGVLVALIDTGINYTLTEFALRLARDGAGRLLGYDYWDMDERPYDMEPARSVFYPLHHGTAVASVLLAEAPQVRLAVYRYPRPQMDRFADLVAHADRSGAQIVNLAMGSNRLEEWQAMEKAARARPHMLFIVSAGNDGRDIDEEPVYPAALTPDNFLVVTSADGFGRLAEGSNWGRTSVDVMVPGEQIDVIDHRGAAGKASGSSFAVPRITALAARLLSKNPEWDADKLKQAITGRGRPSKFYSEMPVRFGWVPDPTDDFVN